MWDWLVWAALGVAIVVGIAAIGRFVVSLLRFLRDFKRARRALFRELDRVGAAAAEIGERAAVADGGSERLTAALDRLAASRRRLAVLQSAVDEVSDAVGRVTVFYPRK
jgi:ABC-type transporter Mla subunit MlaD